MFYKKIFTFKFYLIDGRTTTICAESIDQAKCLYDDYCRNDLGYDKIIELSKIEVIYDKNDAIKFGKYYGTPKQYNFKTIKRRSK